VQHHAVHTMPMEHVDDIMIAPEDRLDINESTDRCVYYANLHRMVPVEQPETNVCAPTDTRDANPHLYVQAHKAHLVTLTKLDYEALRSRFAFLPADVIQKTFGSTMQTMQYA